MNVTHPYAEDAAEGVADEMYPILSDAEYLPSLHMAILKSDGWTTPELCKAVQFAWGVLLREYGCRPAFTGMWGGCGHWGVVTMEKSLGMALAGFHTGSPPRLYTY